MTKYDYDPDPGEIIIEHERPDGSVVVGYDWDWVMAVNERLDREGQPSH